MVMDKYRRIFTAFGISIGVMIVSGIALSAISGVAGHLESTVRLKFSFWYLGDSHYWIVGLVFILPGIIGISAGIARRRKCYIVTMFTFVLMFIILALVVFLHFQAATSKVLYGCSGYLCGLDEARRLGIGMLSVLGLGSIAMLAATVTSGFLICKKPARRTTDSHRRPYSIQLTSTGETNRRTVMTNVTPRQGGVDTQQDPSPKGYRSSPLSSKSTPPPLGGNSSPPSYVAQATSGGEVTSHHRATRHERKHPSGKDESGAAVGSSLPHK